MSTWLLALLFIVGAICVGFVPSQLLRKRYGGLQPADSRALASDVSARIGVLHGLILSLVFASAHSGMQSFENDVELEASAAAHVHFNAKRYGAPELQAATIDYLTAAIDKDWPMLRDRNELSAEGWTAWRRMLEGSLALNPANRHEQVLADRIQADIWVVRDLRQLRGLEAAKSLSGEFWLIAIVGLVLIATLLFVHEIKPLNQAIMAMYSGFTGLTLFLIYDMSHPFLGALAIEPSAFQMALASIRSGI